MGHLRPTRATAWVVAASVALISLSTTTRDAWLVLLAGTALAAVAAAVVLRPRLEALHVEVSLGARSRVGGEPAVGVVVTNQGTTPAAPCVLTIGSRLLEPTTVEVPPLDPGTSARCSTTTTARRRGVLDVVHLTLASSAPLDLVRSTVRSKIRVDALVRPAAEGAVEVRPSGCGDGDPTPSRLPGLDVQGVREWRRGEPTVRLYARGTARHSRPLVLDRHDDTGLGLAVLVGAGHRQPLWEGALAVAAETLAVTASAGHPCAALARQRGGVEASIANADAALDWFARVGEPERLTPADVARAAQLVGGGTVLVVDAADELRVEDDGVRSAFASAARDAGAVLAVLHPFSGRTDALCMHEVR